ncbi:MAG: HAMP domain-containing sensor histidine kinase, partial [Myxococcota bacterium]
TRVLVAEARRPGRFQELGPQLETVCVFAGLAVARLELLAELKREVDRQSREIAEITSHRLHAEFVRGVAHELRKPNEEVYELAVQLANRLESDDSQVDQILATSAEMSRRLDLLLFHSGVRLDRRRIDLVQVVEDAVSRVTRLTHDREFEVHHAQSQLPLIADPTRLASVVENLVDNAVKATEAGARIRVSSKFDSERCQESGPRVVLEVEDNGVGIEPEDVVRVFDPGVALLPGGFGLGLALCREIVRLHGGSIEMEPLSVGCRVRVRLPRFAESD